MSDLDELESLLREATAGPWVHWAGTGLVIRPHSGADCAEDLRVCEVSVNTFRDQGRHNADLIAALRNHAEELIRDARLWQEHCRQLQRTAEFGLYDEAIAQEKKG